MKQLLKELTPPVLWKSMGRLRRASRRFAAKPNDGKWTFGAEHHQKFYDETFEDYQHWKTHYTASRYYPVWTVIATAFSGKE